MFYETVVKRGKLSFTSKGNRIIVLCGVVFWPDNSQESSHCFRATGKQLL